MPGTQDQDTVNTLSYRLIGEDGKVSPGTSPIPALRTSIPKKNDEEINSSSLGEAKNDETPPPVPPKSQALLDGDLFNLNTKVPLPSLEETKGEETHVDVPQNSILSRYPSQETVFDDPDDLGKTLTRLSRESSNKLSNVPSTSPPSYKTDDSEESLSLNFDVGGTTNKKTNRFLPRAKYSMQQKGFIIFGATAIAFGTSAALLYLQDKEKFIAFFTNSPKYITIPVIALAALLAISPILFAIRQFKDTAEHKTQEKNADGILDEVLKHQPEGKAIKSVRLEYSNGTHSNFVLNAWEAKNNFINIDEKVVGRTNKIESVINNRPLFTALLTGVVAANIALPLGLLATNGFNGVQKFYQNPLTNDIGLSLLIGSGVLALLILCLGVHYYRKTNCTNLIYSREKIGAEGVNEKFTQEIKQERTNVLGENHGKDAKRCSLTLEQVVVQSHNCKDAVYSVG